MNTNADTEFRKRLIAIATCKRGNEIYFPLIRANALAHISQEGSVYLKHIPNIKMNKEMMFSDIIQIDNKLLLVPHKCYFVVIYDTDSHEFFNIELRKSKVLCNERINEDGVMYSGFANGKYAYLLGWSYPEIIKIDTKNFTISYINDWVYDANKYIPKGDVWGLFMKDCCYIDKSNEQAFAFSAFSKGYVLLNLSTDENEFIYNDKLCDGTRCICACKNEVWMTGKFGDDITIWNRNDDSYERINLSSCIQEIDYVDKIIFDEISERVYVFFYAQGDIYVIDRETRKLCDSLSVSNMPVDKEYNGRYLPKYINPRIKGRKLTFITSDTREWHEYDLKNGRDYVSTYTVDYMNSGEYIKEWYRNLADYGIVVNEGLLDLRDFLKGIYGEYN